MVSSQLARPHGFHRIFGRAETFAHVGQALLCLPSSSLCHARVEDPGGPAGSSPSKRFEPARQLDGRDAAVTAVAAA
jgi:hypothetical protein